MHSQKHILLYRSTAPRTPTATIPVSFDSTNTTKSYLIKYILYKTYIYITCTYYYVLRIYIFFRAPPTAPGWWFHQRNRKTSQASSPHRPNEHTKGLFYSYNNIYIPIYILFIIILYIRMPAGAHYTTNDSGGRFRCFL